MLADFLWTLFTSLACAAIATVAAVSHYHREAVYHGAAHYDKSGEFTWNDEKKP